MIRELDVGQSALLTDIAMCLNYYRLFSPGLYCCIQAAVQLDEVARLFPGVILNAFFDIKMMAIRDLFAELSVVFNELDPALNPLFRPPASEAEISATELTILVASRRLVAND